MDGMVICVSPMLSQKSADTVYFSQRIGGPSRKLTA